VPARRRPAAALAGACGLVLALVLASCSSGAPDPANADPTATSGGTARAGADPTVVDTTAGPIQGTDDGSVRRYLGVPFAQPPVGRLRFAMPQPPVPWTKVRDATQMGPVCAQVGPDATKPNGSEDCLYLNVYAPSKSTGAGGAPVMVWLHGGGFTVGSPNFTDGSQLANLYGVIVVAPAYRLGPIGFAGLDALAAEDEHHSTGSYGLADQQMALQWVHNNIAAFGGNAGNVTLFGESAGGWSVCAHMVSPRSAGLFQKAIVESGPCNMPLVTPEKSRQQGEQLAEAVGCTAPGLSPTDPPSVDLDCLRAKPVDELLAAIPDDGTFGLHGGTRWSPTIDGWVLDQPIEDAMKDGLAANVPLMIGWNTDEGRLFNGLAYLEPGKPLSVETYREAFRTLTNGDEATAAQIESHYPLINFNNANDAFSQVLGDAALKCPARQVAITLAQQNRKVFVYSFAYANAAETLPIASPNGQLGAYHSAEVQYVFDQPIRMDDPVDRRLALDLSARWARFARTGDPNGAPYASDPAWPRFMGSDDPFGGGQNIVFGPTNTTGVALDFNTCSFWDTLDYRWAQR
jgi:para-nitrobenzyl esterase